MPHPDPYALGRFRTARGGEFCGVVVDAQTVPLIELTPDFVDVHELLADWPVYSKMLDAAVVDARTSGQWQELARPVDTLQVLAPVEPAQIFQSGANYKTHVVQLMVAAAAEAGDDDPDATLSRATDLMQQRAERGTPYVFLGLPSSICGPYDDVVLPDIGTQHDWELELAAVIGTEAYRVDRADAMAHVAGYVMVNDITTRDRVFRPDMPGLGTDWLAGKNSPTFLPVGPWFVPAQFVPDPSALRITLALNGDVMQDESTADMIFDVPRLVEHVSAITPMRPGDLLLTGSPAGNGAHYGRYLRPDDVMDATITGLGRQRNRCVAP
ncbi:fumarylacetoacetate hydrolase family protein [Jatrophihabitans fulvus]